MSVISNWVAVSVLLVVYVLPLNIIAIVDNLPGFFYNFTCSVIATAVDSDSESSSVVMQYNSC